MSVTQPKDRIAYTERELGRLRSDLEDWKRDHTDLVNDCWFWEDLIAKTKFHFGRILDLESDFQRHVVKGDIAYDREIDQEITALYQGWVEVGIDLVSEVRRLQGVSGEIEGAEDFLLRFEEAQAILDSRAIEQDIPPVSDISHLAKGNPRPDHYGW